MSNEEWKKQAERVAELGRDRHCRAYLLGRFCAGATAAELADLVEGALVYRERFGAPGNDRRTASAEVVNGRPAAERWSSAALEEIALANRDLPDL